MSYSGSACPYGNQVVGGLRCLCYSQNRNYLIVECVQCRGRRTVSKGRWQANGEHCVICPQPKPAPTPNERFLAKKAAEEEQAAEQRKQREEAAAREAEERKQKELLAQTQRDAEAARQAYLEAERIRKQLEAEATAMKAAAERERQRVERIEREITAALDGLSDSEARECEWVVKAWGQPLDDPSWWQKARSTVEARKAAGKEFRPGQQ